MPQAETLEITSATLPIEDRVRQNGGGDQVSRRSILSLNPPLDRSNSGRMALLQG
jgi:hypothetical protein